MTADALDVQRLSRWVKGMFLLWFVTVIGFAWMLHNASVQARGPDANAMLRVRALEIVDGHGVIRVRLAAPLPEPVVMGKQVKRDDTVSGVMLYDALGNERGGYVTDNSVGNAFLTLDSNVGQEVTLVAYPNGGAEFGISDHEKNKVVLAAMKSGPLLRLVERGTVVFQQPSVVEK
jgi:hypothetical protein